jgi:glycosyltransferase involved in cell wall biosynthesis
LNERVRTLLVDARPVDHPTARRRGIGRYVTGLLDGLVAVGAPVVALYGADVEAATLSAAIPDLPLRRWSPQVIREHAEAGTWYLATQLMLHPVSLDPIPKVVTEAHLPVAAVMYDVIPYRFPEIYQVDPNARCQALLRASLARTVDTLLAISEFAADTAATELGFPRSRIGVIGAGVDAKFAPPSDDPRPRSARVIPSDVGPYVVAVTGGDDRKNTEGLIRAWALAVPALDERQHLVIATAHAPDVLRRWEACADEVGIRDRVIFTGALDDDELVAVLQGAALSVMPSFEEGFGLPVLEAAACGVPAICSNLTSLPEVLDEPSACFDPHAPRSIADAIVRALTDDGHRSVLLDAGERAVRRWTWPHVATATLDTLGSSGPRWPQRIVPPRRRVAFAGAFAGSADALGDDNEAIVGAITRHRSDTEWTVFVDSATSPEPTHANPNRWPVRALGRFVKPWDFDHVVAILGSAPHHVATSEVARTVPCHLWIHDDGLVSALYGANFRALSIARSVIVTSDDAADRVRRASSHQCPVLVVSGACEHLAAAIAEWLDDVDDCEPSTIRHR